MILTDGASITITIPDSLQWVDEYDWTTVAQDVQRNIGGGIVVSESVVTAGRPITLVSGVSVWITKAVFDTLIAAMNIINKTYTLTVADGTTYSVIFNRENGTPVIGAPIFRQNVRANEAFYTVTLRLMEV